MKEKKELEVATNVSSGAEKVEAVEKEVKEKNGKTQTTRVMSKKVTPKKNSGKSEEKIDVKKMNADSTDGKAERESEAAKARVAMALKKKEEKLHRNEEKVKLKKEKAAAKKSLVEKRAAEHRAKIEKRAAARKALIEKLVAEQKALVEKRKAEKEARIRERAHNKANRSNARQHAKDGHKNDRRARKTEGYGGWLAAVISLGAVTLALTTAVTVGAIDMKRTKDGMMSGYRGTTYELIGIMENVDNDLDRARVSASSAQQSRILTDLLVQARLAESDLEKMPVSVEADQNLTGFINRVAFESERMLAKLRKGEKLSAKDEAILEQLYETNHEIRTKLDEFASGMQDGMIMDYIKKGEGDFANIMQGLEEMTLEENRIGLENKHERKEREEDSADKEKEKKPSMEVSSREGGLEPKIDCAKAEELCKEYFSDYKIHEFQCVGETTSRGYGAYNVQGYDDKGTLLFAEVDYTSGALLRFDYFENCHDETFDLDNSKLIAENFLDKLGYTDMTAVRVRGNGTDADFTFVYETDGAVFYPDEVRVKICRTRGVVTGFDATKYVRHHKDRTYPETAVTMEAAKESLHDGIRVETSRLAVVQAAGGERTAYEFLCSYKDEKYFIYTDAMSGEELAIVNVKDLGL